MLLIASLIAIVARRIRMPYTVGLVAVGCAFALTTAIPQPKLTKELLFTVLLPPLIFEAAIQIEWRSLREEMPLVGTLATFGIFLATGLAGTAIHFILGWEWLPSMILAGLLAATDPVSVIALLRESGFRSRARFLLETESLLNDGTAAVLFVLLISAAATGTTNIGAAIVSFLLVTLGGLAFGLLVGAGALFLMGKRDGRIAQICATSIAAYGAFLLAEYFQTSGVLATLTCGLLIGNSATAIGRKGTEGVLHFWEYAAFAANSVVFLLIGLHMGSEKLSGIWLEAVVAIIAVLAGRACAVYGCAFLFSGSRLRVSIAQQHFLFWGGMRGALALALALGIPADVPQRRAIVGVAFAVVAFSIVVQGLTIKPLLARIEETKPRVEGV